MDSQIPDRARLLRAPLHLERQFMQGLILLGLIGFGGFLLYDFGLWRVLLAGDKSYLSFFILALWGAASARWLWLLHRLKRAEAALLPLYLRALNHGWLAADLALKLGLMGTIIGFIFMLTPLSELAGLDAASLQSLLAAMGDGMAIALYTTLTGLVVNVLLRLQYQLVADTLQALSDEADNAARAAPRAAPLR